MKISELIKLKEHRYHYKIHSHFRKWYENNVDKDIVVAYIKEKFCNIILVKCRGNDFRILRYIDNDLLEGGYVIFPIAVLWSSNGSHYCKKTISILKDNEDVLTILDEDSYRVFNRKMILNCMENK